MLVVPVWLQIGGAVVLAAAVLWVGVTALRSVSGVGGQVHTRHPEEAEDVADLDVFFVCGECGTEYKVTQLGELHVPRHCGETMTVVRRPVV